MKTIPDKIQKIPLLSLIKMLFIGESQFPENFLFFNSGRATIKWLLSQLKSLKGKKLTVGLPCYLCYTVYQAVEESGNDALLLDIDPFNFSVSGKLSEQAGNLDVLIWVNYFGFRYSDILKEVRTRFPGLIIVEDCCHVDIRDFIKTTGNENPSDYSVFSFNSGKPITIGGGGLLVTSKERNEKTAPLLFTTYSQLPFGKPGPKELLRRFKLNFSFIYLIFSWFKAKSGKGGGNSFSPEEKSIEILAMNPALKKLIYAQIKMRSAKKMAEKCTRNYFKKMPEMPESFTFGSLSFYPVRISAADEIMKDKNIDKFLLWGNIAEHYKYFGIDITEKDFSLTFGFLSGSIFLPASFFGKEDRSRKER
jgi:DegT/DnrJ/EryC1/StrS aminotransferase family